MSRIAPEDMTTLISAAEAKSVSASAVAELEEMQVAHCINESANCGEYSAVYAKPISAALLTKLQTNHYEVTQPTPIAKPGDVCIISWKNAPEE
jgi:hypothetical protein